MSCKLRVLCPLCPSALHKDRQVPSSATLALGTCTLPVCTRPVTERERDSKTSVFCRSLCVGLPPHLSWQVRCQGWPSPGNGERY